MCQAISSLSTSPSLRPLSTAVRARSNPRPPPLTRSRSTARRGPARSRPSLSPRRQRRQNVPGYALVRHERDLALERGRNTVRYTDVAALIDPTTVAFESLTDPRGTSVVEQNFQFDLVNTAKLLEKYIDRSVTVDQIRGNGVESYTGTLLSTAGGLVLRRPDGTIQTLPHNAGVRLPELPGRPHHASDAGVGHRRASARARTRAACRTRPAASRGGPITT